MISFLLSLHMGPLQKQRAQLCYLQHTETLSNARNVDDTRTSFLLYLPFCFLDIWLCVSNYLSAKRPQVSTQQQLRPLAAQHTVFYDSIQYAEETGKLAFLHFVTFIRAKKRKKGRR